MSVQFLSQIFKPLASFVFFVPANAKQDQELSRPEPEKPDDRPELEKSDDRPEPSRQVLDMLYNIDMSSGEGMCLSELYMCNASKK